MKAWTLVMAVGVSTVAWAAVDLAKVNGKPITDKDMTSALSGFNDSQRINILKDLNSRRQILSNLIDQEVLLQQAEKEKLDQDADYRAAVATFRKQYLASRVLQKNIAGKLTESAAKSYYSTHKSRFSTDQAHVQHILLADEASAAEMLKKAKAPNADFQELAEKHSKDPSAKNNRGDLGAITRDSPFVKEFKDAAFAAAEGDVVGPVRTTYGYHVIKVVQKKPGKTLGYDEVELHVKDELRQQMVEEYLSKVRASAKIQVDDRALEKM